MKVSDDDDDDISDDNCDNHQYGEKLRGFVAEKVIQKSCHPVVISYRLQMMMMMMIMIMMMMMIMMMIIIMITSRTRGNSMANVT